MHNRTRNGKRPIKLLDCWNQRYFTVDFNSKHKVNHDKYDSINRSKVHDTCKSDKTQDVPKGGVNAEGTGCAVI